MFKKTINFSDLNNGQSSLATELRDGEVLQILHRGCEIKIMLTQEHYFNLLARLDKAETTSKTTDYNPEKMIEAFQQKMEQLDEILNKNKK